MASVSVWVIEWRLKRKNSKWSVDWGFDLNQRAYQYQLVKDYNRASKRSEYRVAEYRRVDKEDRDVIR